MAEQPNLTRRALLTGGAGLVVGAAAASAVAVALPREGGGAAPTPTPSAGEATPVHGPHQAGVAAPAVPQQHAVFAVFDVPDATAASLPGVLADLGAAIAAVAAPGATTRFLPDGPGDLTVTVGLGPRLLGLVRPGLEAAATLPSFTSDGSLEASGGDLLLLAAASDPTVPPAAIEQLGAPFAPRWQQVGFRGADREGAVRNPLGYWDGVIVPRTPEALDQGVWIADGPLAGGTICVVRRFRLAIDRFRSLAPDAQDAVFGRRQSDGQPLSGGEAFGEVDLSAKTPEGDYLVGAHAHARAAHPSFTGSPLMLRRSYGYDAGGGDRGVVFLSYQNDVATFARTQQRLDEVDALMGFATATASAAFAVLPGFGDAADAGLGASLRA